MDEYNTLVLSGGGIKGLLILGALEYLYETGKLQKKNIRKYIGTSIGAIINVLLIIGYEPKEICAHIVKSRFFDDIKSKITPLSGFSGKGFLNYGKVSKLLENLIKEKIGSIPTIKEFCKKYDIIFLAVSFDYTDQKEYTISMKNSPELNLLDALRMTSNVPFLFDPFEYKGKKYFDGFLTNNYAIDKLDINHDTAIGVFCETVKNNKESEHSSNWNLFWEIILIPLNQLQEYKRKPYQDSLLNLRIVTKKEFDFDINLNVRNVLDSFSDGYVQIKNII